MANLKEQEKWEDGIYQIEENDPVLGGADGITNKPIIQLANRTTWLKKALELLTGKSKPKDLTADSASVADKDGHSHALPKSSTSQQGIVQLDDTWESDSREKAPTARVIKAMKQLIDSLTRNLSNYIPNSKKSNATNSTSSDTLATSLAVKTAYDKGVEAKTAADNAQRTANDGVNKANAAQTAANNAQRTATDGVNKANAAKTAADNAQRTANAKQSPATTLSGYGITDFVVKGEPS
ncbi:tail fiber protein, partial [Rodentibacter ratti]|uniref:tail fiber protein n=1 Tax=Rodentibacter ratti TaxID=1906745 RepID=UPI0015C3F390